jgi:ParB/RepB/Spo0J family partition protein
MKKTANEIIHSLRLAEIVRSATNRTHFKPEALEEMASSIREKGIILPVVVRLVSSIEDDDRRKEAGDAKYELVIGERRWRGSKIAGKEEIPAVIRELTDHEALKLQVIENAQRENPDPLDEAEQYDALFKSGKTTVDELVAELGKSKATIYGRIKLLSLPEKVKDALRAGKITAQVALLIARIANPKLAEEAAARILKGNHDGQPFSFRQVQAIMAQEYMTQLKGAPFDPKDKTLVPAAGPCALCPKRSGNQKDLFPEVGRADVCTDPVCFRQKCDAARTRLLESAQQEGKVVLSPLDSAELYQHGSHLRYDAPVVELDADCPFASKKTWRQIVTRLPKDERPDVIVATDRLGALHEVIGRKEAGEAARTLDLARPHETRGSMSATSVQQGRTAKIARDNHERTIRATDLAISGIIEKQAKAKDTKALFRLLRALVVKEANFDTERRVAKRHGFTTPKKDGEVRAFYDTVAKKAEAAPVPFILETLLWKSSLFAQDGLPEAMTNACKIYGLDPKKIEAAAKDKPAQSDEPTLPALKK